MNREKTTRWLFLKLRELLEHVDLGYKPSDIDILKAASAFVDSITERNEVDPFRIYAIPHEVPVDKALADGGWNVMDRNSQWGSDLYEDESEMTSDMYLRKRTVSKSLSEDET